eukprot:10092641-Alexandrium_andersonii.AAC.1
MGRRIPAQKCGVPRTRGRRARSTASGTAGRGPHALPGGAATSAGSPIWPRPISQRTAPANLRHRGAR